MKYYSHIEDKVFLTPEELVELKLTQKDWVVEIGFDSISFSIINKLYNNTNLFTYKTAYHYTHNDYVPPDILCVSPITKIIVMRGQQRYGKLFPHATYYIHTADSATWRWK